MAFPPNYGQERRSREAAKQRKAREKQMKREEKSSTRRHEPDGSQDQAPGADTKKEL